MYINAQEKVCKEAPRTVDGAILWGTAGVWWSSKGALVLGRMYPRIICVTKNE